MLGRVRSVAVTLALVLVGMLAVPAGAMNPAAVESGRVAGDGRLETAVAIAQRSFPSGSEVAYLARADQFADALAAGTLTDGPILLVPSSGELPPVVADEIDRLDPDEVVALGGTAAVGDDILGAAADGRASGRAAGPNRYETAVAIAERGFTDGAGTVYLASGDDSPDAVAGGVLTGGPILVLPSNGDLLDVVTDAVADLDPDEVVALGGTAAITDEQLNGTAGGRDTDRLSGPTRFATAMAIAQEEFGDTAGSVYLARGDAFADAVAAGSLTDGPILLVPSCGGIPDEPRAYLEDVTTSSVVALGGTAAVCEQLLDDAAKLPAAGDPDPVPAPDPNIGPGTLYSGWVPAARGGEVPWMHFFGVDMESSARSQVHDVPGNFWYYVNRYEQEFFYEDDGQLFVYDLSRPGTLKDTVDIPDLPEPEYGFVSTTFEGSPDGAHFWIDIVVYVYDEDYDELLELESYLWVVDRDGEVVVEREGEFVHHAIWAPDGDLIAQTHNVNPDDESAGDIIRIDGGALTSGTIETETLASDRGGWLAALSHAGDQVAVVTGSELYVQPLSGAEPTHIATPAGGDRFRHGTIYDVAFSPDDAQIAFTPMTDQECPNDPFPFCTNVGRVNVVDNHRDADPLEIDAAGGGDHELRDAEDNVVGTHDILYWVADD